MLGPERYAAAKRVFLEASGLPRGDRTRFVETQCDGDDELREQVRRLLTVDETCEGFLDRPALAAAGGVGLAAGTRLGRYRVVRLLGEGGMGVVYEAEQDEPARRVALKLIHPGLLSERLRSRFRHEIRVLGQLRHPGIAQIYDAGTLELGDGAGTRVPYFAMELIEGRPLLECAAALKLGTRERLELVAQVCDAVHHAHQKGVVHRDLKPANILVEETGSAASDAESGRPPLQVKVLDFGVARVTDADVRAVTMQTSAHQLVGTVPYMSPEQAASDPQGVDTRTDVYSIGVVAFELLAGRLPHAIQGKGLHEAVRSIRDDEPARLGSIDRAFRGDAETIIGKALEKDRERRYASAAEMGADVRRFLRDEPIAARPASAFYQLRKFARRHKPMVAGVAIAFGAMAVATGVSVWQARDAMRARGTSDRNAAEARREANRASLAAASAALSQGDPIGARDHLDATDESARAWGWRYWDAHHDRCIALIEPGVGAPNPEGRSWGPLPVAGAWFAADGASIVIASAGGTLRTCNPWGTPGPVAVQLAADRVHAAVPAGPGRVAATHGSDRTSLSLSIFDAADGRIVRRVAASLHRPIRLGASADGSVIAAHLRSASEGDRIAVWRAEAGEAGEWGEPIHVEPPETPLVSIALSADGGTLAASHTHLSVWGLGDALTAASGAPARLGSVPFGWNVTFTDLSPDGGLALTGGHDRLVRLWDAQAVAPLLSMRGHTGAITAIALHPSGRLAASAGSDLTIRVWDVERARATPAGGDEPDASATRAVLTGLAQPAWHLRFNADGSRLLSVSVDGAVRLWTPEPEEGVGVLRGHTNFVYGVAFTPDGSRIVSGAWDGTLRVWDAASGEPGLVIPTGGGNVGAMAVSPDGRTVVSGHQAGYWTGSLRLWRVEDGARLAASEVPVPAVMAVAMSPDGDRVIAGTRTGSIYVLDPETGRVSPGFGSDSGAGFALAFSPDGKYLATGHEDNRVCVRDGTNGFTLRTLAGHEAPVRALAFSPVGPGRGGRGGADPSPLLASGSADRTVRLWDPETGRCLGVLDRHWDAVYAVVFSPDGSTLATGSNDATIRIWDVATRDEMTQLRGHGAYVYSLAFSPDGRMLASGSGDHTVRVWDTRPVRERWAAKP